MTRFCLAILFVFAAGMAVAQAPQYTIPGRVVLSYSPHIAAFYNSASGAGVATYPQNAWIEIDATRCVAASDPCVPPEAIGIILSTILIITQGGDPYISDVTLHVRAPGSTESCWNYLGQTIETSPQGGQRSNFFSAVPLINGKFQLCRNTLRLGSFYDPPLGGPQAFGFNARIIGYILP